MGRPGVAAQDGVAVEDHEDVGILVDELVSGPVLGVALGDGAHEARPSLDLPGVGRVAERSALDHIATIPSTRGRFSHPRTLRCVTDEEVLDWLRAERARPFRGWEFSYLDGRRETVDTKPWQFDPMLVEAIGRADAMVDLGTGDGRYLTTRLAETARRPRLVCATEGHRPNVPLARDRLAPWGAGMVEVDADGQAPGQGQLPFVDGAFDLVMSRHMEYVAPEVARVLRPGSRLITQQVGDRTNSTCTACPVRPTPTAGPGTPQSPGPRPRRPACRCCAPRTRSS